MNFTPLFPIAILSKEWIWTGQRNETMSQKSINSKYLISANRTVKPHNCIPHGGHYILWNNIYWGEAERAP